MIRVLHVIDKMDPRLGGVCQAVRMLIPGLTKEGVYNEVVSMDEEKTILPGKEEFILHVLGTGKGPWNANALLIPWLIKNYTRFDVIIVHGIWLYHTYAVRKALTAFKKKYASSESKMPKLFVMPHGMLDPYFQRAAGRRLKAIRNWIYWQLIEQKNINHADGLFFTCTSERQLAKQPFNPYHPKKEIVIGLGIEKPPAYNYDMQKTFLEKCPSLKDQRYLLFLGRVHEKKGVDILIRAFDMLCKNNMDTAGEAPLTLLIAGPGLDTDYGKMIQQVVTETENIKNSVIFCGMLTGAAKWGAFYGCDAFVLPSHQENFGIAVVEALACGKPVLISNQVNIWEDIEKAGAGIVANNTTEDIYTMLHNWSKINSADKTIFCHNARELHQKEFAIETTARKLTAVLNDEY